MKNVIRKRFRDKIRALRVPSEAPYYQLVLDFINTYLINPQIKLWDTEFKRIMLSQFPNSLTESDMDSNIMDNVDRKILFSRFLDLSAIR
jgi:hypothetical protein